MEILFVFDLDHTLLHTEGVYGYIRNVICKATGASLEEYDRTYKEHQSKYGFLFNLEHILTLTKDKKIVRDAMEEYHKAVAETEKFLFKDSIPALEAVGPYGKIVLFTYGERGFQTEKVLATGLYKYCDAFRAVEKKSIDEIDRCIKSLQIKPDIIISLGDTVSDAVAFKDYSVHTKIPVITIRIRRPEGKYFNQNDNQGVVDYEYANVDLFVKDFLVGKFKEVMESRIQ